MRLHQEEFRRLIRQALNELPPQIESVLQNVALLVEDWPSDEELDNAGLENRGDLFGLYMGVPLPEREGGLPPLPDTIVLYQRPIEAVCASREEVIREITVTLRHEIGHYLGMGESDLDRLGYG